MFSVCIVEDMEFDRVSLRNALAQYMTADSIA